MSELGDASKDVGLEETRRVLQSSFTSSDKAEKLYEEWAGNYEENVRTWGYQMPELCSKALSETLSQVDKDSIKLIDIGAGDGLVGAALCQEGFKKENLTAQDISQAMLEVAKQREAYGSFIKSDLTADRVPLPDNSFDALTCVGVTSHFQPEPAVSEMIRKFHS
mmetsp:Transcript_27211/g.42555  ORF Transcript_27211/g.42555 Transcript_27211/m.42555 type:complete len:165 (-) Transcript_27211:705-1199(-)